MHVPARSCFPRLSLLVRARPHSFVLVRARLHLSVLVPAPACCSFMFSPLVRARPHSFVLVHGCLCSSVLVPAPACSCLFLPVHTHSCFSHSSMLVCARPRLFVLDCPRPRLSPLVYATSSSCSFLLSLLVPACPCMASFVLVRMHLHSCSFARAAFVLVCTHLYLCVFVRVCVCGHLYVPLPFK